MTNEELQAHIAALNKAADDGEIQMSDSNTLGMWRNWTSKHLLVPDAWRIKPKPREVWINCYGAGGMSSPYPDRNMAACNATIDRSVETVKFREVLSDDPS